MATKKFLEILQHQAFSRPRVRERELQEFLANVWGVRGSREGKQGTSVCISGVKKSH